MSEHDIRQSARLKFRDGLNSFPVPRSFPYEQWQTLQDWTVAQAHLAYYIGRGQFDDSRPSDEWFIRTYGWIEAGWEFLNSTKNPFRFMLFHDIEAPPTTITVDAYLGDLPWTEAQAIYVQAHHDEVVEGPKLEPFDMPDTEATMKMAYFTEADLTTHALAAGYNYAFRKSGMDILVRAALADLSLIRDGIPVVDEFVRGITIEFGANAG